MSEPGETSDLRLFFRAIKKHTVEAVTGVGFSLVSVLWGIAQWARPTLAVPLFRPWMLALAGIALLTRAVYFAWRDEHEARVQAESAATANRSDFQGFINQMAIDDPVNGLCDVYALVSVENRGDRPSILHNWKVYIQRPGELEIEVPTRQPLDDEDCVLRSDSGNHVTISASEFIARKAYPQAIDPGHGCRGFYRFVVPAGLPEFTRFILTFKDVQKQLYSCEYDPALRKERSDDVADLGSWPGVKIRHGRATAEQKAPLSAAEILSHTLDELPSADD
jgi:hypothetical protein